MFWSKFKSSAFLYEPFNAPFVVHVIICSYLSRWISFILDFYTPELLKWYILIIFKNCYIQLWLQNTQWCYEALSNFFFFFFAFFIP